ncbi:hypothetical protein BDQ17DRAFT_1328857 [Cyathus striatus]|nr:hypothetical protein BDQ17DRAFT_1328857 [Cyathus striatus]
MLLKVTRPEMDLQEANLFEICASHPDAIIRKTSMDVLEVNNDLLTDEDKVVWKEDLDHGEVLNYLENVHSVHSYAPRQQLVLSPQTGVRIPEDTVTFPNISPMHYNYFTKRNAQGDVIGVERTYFCDTMSSMEVPLVHFTYDFLAPSAVYFISRYP